MDHTLYENQLVSSEKVRKHLPCGEPNVDPLEALLRPLTQYQGATTGQYLSGDRPW